MYLRIAKLTKIWLKIELQAFSGAWQSNSTEEQHGQNNVRKGGRKVHHLQISNILSV